MAESSRADVGTAGTTTIRSGGNSVRRLIDQGDHERDSRFDRVADGRRMIALTTGSATDVGRVRAHNEDSVLVASPMFAVADGMGGYAGGATASAIAVDHLARLARETRITSEDVFAALVEANREIVVRGLTDVETLGMGTTVAGLALVDNGGADYWLVFNVGDSRVYRFVDDALVQLSVDHSYIQELVDEGRITPEQALTHPERNVVTRALGSEPDVAPDLWLLSPESGEVFVLCSDGLTREVSVSRIADLLRGASDPQDACDQLVAAAVESGGRDNVSVVVVRVDPSTEVELTEATSPPAFVHALLEPESAPTTTPATPPQVITAVPIERPSPEPAESAVPGVIEEVPGA